MYKILKAIKSKIDFILSTAEATSLFSGLSLLANRSRIEDAPALTYEYDEFATNDGDEIGNAMISITLHSLKGKRTIEHYKMVELLKTNLDKLQFNNEDINGTLYFNSISRVSDRDDAEQTTIIFDIRYFITQSCDK